MQLAQYLHTALLVSDLEKAAHFYGTVLGLPKVERSLKFPGIWYQVGAVQIHLIQDEGVEIALQNAAKWGRNAHLAIAVDSVAAARDHLQAHGYAVQVSASGRAALFVQDPDGNVIELSEPT
ncbi:VOC family protein [Leptolyngbya sp. AN02str]|uniref:VOC family protein n=1 Tax=Leptolyngbya sp. AN02str TaxID=3423363 RepID=UPI003D314020